MAQCMTPFSVRDMHTSQSLSLPCGKCPACYARRVSQWSFRLQQEEKRSQISQFITLTYETKFVPITKNLWLTLDKTHLQTFFKRLRKRHPAGTEIKYYAVGEYGTDKNRPHYHIILFNAQPQHVESSWSIYNKKTKKSTSLGQVHYGTVTGASIGYTLKYLNKTDKIDQTPGDDRIPEFALYSKGIGENYLTKAMQAWHKKDLQNRMHCSQVQGQVIPMPKYYKEKLYSKQQKKAIGYNAAKNMEKNLQENLKKDPQYYRNKFQSDKAAFTNLAYNANKNKKL